MKLGFIGLGKMGSQIVSKLLEAKHEVVVYDLNQTAVDALARHGAVAASDRQDMLGKLGKRPIIWLMIPADYVGAEVEQWLELLPAGSVLIDGGNSMFEQTIARAKQCMERGIEFVDVGTSGGVMGMQHGFSMMVGGNEAVVKRIKPILNVLARPHGGVMYAGQNGAGHFVKMVHNGIEYGIMQAYAEGYDLIKYGPMPGIDLAAVAEVWQKGSIISSTLNSLTADILRANPELDGVDGFVAASGEGQWTSDTAKKSNIGTPALDAALQVRLESQKGRVYFATKLLAAMRTAFGGHSVNKEPK